MHHAARRMGSGALSGRDLFLLSRFGNMGSVCDPLLLCIALSRIHTKNQQAKKKDVHHQGPEPAVPIPKRKPKPFHHEGLEGHEG